MMYLMDTAYCIVPITVSLYTDSWKGQRSGNSVGEIFVQKKIPAPLMQVSRLKRRLKRPRWNLLLFSLWLCVCVIQLSEGLGDVGVGL